MALCNRVVLLLFLTLPRTFYGADMACVFAGSCILPCSFDPGGEEVIHWIQMIGFKTEVIVHSFYRNNDQLEQQHQYFKGRTALFKDQISGKGNASLRLTGVKIQDQGQYKCYVGTKTGSKESFLTLNVDAPVRKVHIQRVEDRITCSSEGVYPKPVLTWTTSPQSNETLQNQTTVQKTEQLLYSISSSLVAAAPDLDYSCTVRTQMNQRKATWFLPTSISGSHTETTIPCRSSNSTPTGLIWRFNHTQVILNRTGTDSSVSEAWRPHVRSGSESVSLTLKDLSSNQEGIYSCEFSDAEETSVSSSFLRLQGSPGVHARVIVVLGVILVLALIVLAIIFGRKMVTQNGHAQQPLNHNNVSEEQAMVSLNGQQMTEEQ